MERTFLLFLLEVTAKATTIVGLAALACWLLRRASAAVRHFVWMVAIVSVLVLPALTLVMPKWSVYTPALQSRPTERKMPEQVWPISRAPTSPTEQPAERVRPHPLAIDQPISSSSIRNRTMSASPDPLRTSPARPTPRSNDEPIIRSPALQVSFPFLLLVLWAAGAATAVCRLVVGHLGLWWIQRHSDPITDPIWLDLSRRVADQLRLSTFVRLLRCRRPTMPVCWGVRRPWLLLPSDADTWTLERRQIVLLHELAHAKRCDYLTQAIAQVAVAVYWFNPFVWLAVRRLRTERERACDDLVLAAGANATDYADHLLEIARTFRAMGCPSWAAVAMARPSQLEGRLLAILDRHRDRRTLTRRVCGAAAALALAMVGTLAALQPAPAPDATKDQPSFQAVSKNRSHRVQADASRTALEPHLTFEGQPLPNPAPPAIVPSVDVDVPELHDIDFELESMVDGIGEGVGPAMGEGVGFGIAGGVEGGVLAGVAGGVEGGVGPGTIPDSERVALDVAQAVRDINTETIELAAIEGALPQLVGSTGERGDTRPEADPRIVAAVSSALKDQSVDVRRQAAVTLSQIRSAQALDALIAATTDQDMEVRRVAVRAISRHKSDGITKALVRALKDSDVDVRQAAMEGVARLRDPQYIDVFAEALEDSNGAVRQQAAHALARMRDARAVPALIMALEDGDVDVRQHAAHALGEIGDARAVDPLVAALKDVNGDVRQQIVHALGRIGRRSAGAEKERE